MTRSVDTSFNTALPADTGTLGTLQRLHFTVPNPLTMLVLGERWKDDPAFGYKGASLKTAENLFIDIARQTLFQGHQAVVFQTEATWTQYSSDATFVAAAKNLDLTSATQLVLSAVPDTGHDPAVGADIRPLTGEAFPVVATYTDLRDALLSDLKRDVETLKSIASRLESELAKVGSSYTAAVTDHEIQQIADAEDSLRAGSASAKAGVGIVSKHPVLVATPAAVVAAAGEGYHLAAGTSSAAADFSVVASRDVALRANRDALVQSVRHAAVQGVASAEVSAHGPALLASRTGDALVLAPTVTLGLKSPASGISAFDFTAGTQQATDTVAVESNKLTSVDSGQNVEIKAASKVSIAVGNFTVVIDTSTITIGTPSGQTVVKISNGEINVNGGPVDSVKVKNGTGVTLTGGGASTVSVKGSGVSLSGAQIKLG